MLMRWSGVVCALILGAWACSSNSSNGGATGGAAGAGSGGSAGFGSSPFGGSAGTQQPDAGVGGAGGGGAGGTAGAGGSAGSAPLPTDVKDSAACKDWCAKLDAACGQPKCDPEYDCKIPAGQCAASTEAYLSCQAQTGSFSCGGDGHTIIHSCDEDPSICAPGTIVGASCEGYCGGKAPSGCYCEPSCKQYNDCCADYDAKCAGSSGTGGTSGFDPYAAPKTCTEANNGKGCCGWGTSPYDQIAYKCSGGTVIAESCSILGCVLDTNGYAACGDGSEYPATPNCFSN